MSEVATPTQEEAVSTSTQSEGLVSFLLDEKPVQQTQQNQSESQQSNDGTTTKKDEVVTDGSYLKEWGWDSKEVADKEIKELREYKEKVKPVEEKQFVNDESKRAYEYLLEGKEDDLYNFLNQKKQVEKLAQTEINESTAADIVMFSMQQKYKDLTKEQIDYKFNKLYSIPKEPVQTDTELDEDFEVRKQEWSEKVKEVKMDLEIEARLAKPEIEKLKSELKLPDIRNAESANSQPSQEDLKALKEAQEAFLADAQKFTNDFSGFTVPVKDKDVDYSVGYNLDKEEKTLVNEKVKTFTEDNFNANAIFADRWINADGKTINTEQMVKDLSRIFIGEKFEQKVALDASNKRMEEYLKQKKNINVNETSVNGQAAFSNEQTENDKVRDAFLNVR